MSEVSAIVAGAAYSYLTMVFLINCSLEIAEKGRKPGVMTLAMSAFWPIVLLLVAFVAAVEAIRRESRGRH